VVSLNTAVATSEIRYDFSVNFDLKVCPNLFSPHYTHSVYWRTYRSLWYRRSDAWLKGWRKVQPITGTWWSSP